MPLLAFSRDCWSGFSPRLAFLSEITFSAGRRSEADSSFSDRRYLRIKPGLRYYFRDTSSTFNGYVGLEFSYSTRKFTSRNDYYYAHLPGDSVVYYDRARVNSPIITTSAQLGVVIAVNRRLKMDWFMGAGVRSIRTSYNELLNPVIGERSRERGGIQVHLPLSSYYIQGNVVRLQVTVGVRILYALPIHEKASI